MDITKRHAYPAQVAALTEFMQENTELAKGLPSSPQEREEMEVKWKELTATLNALPGGAVKSVDKWRQTWRDLKCNTKKRALRQQQSQCDTSIGPSSDKGGELSGDGDYGPPKKRIASFDEEIIRIERDKLELDRDYKAQKIEVLSRIATALEELAEKK